MGSHLRGKTGRNWSRASPIFSLSLSLPPQHTQRNSNCLLYWVERRAGSLPALAGPNLPPHPQPDNNKQLHAAAHAGAPVSFAVNSVNRLLGAWPPPNSALSQGVSVVLLDRFKPGHERGSSHGDGRIYRLAYEEVSARGTFCSDNVQSSSLATGARGVRGGKENKKKTGGKGALPSCGCTRPEKRDPVFRAARPSPDA